MKRILILLLSLPFVLINFQACAKEPPKEITCQDVIDAYSQYEEYSVFHKENDHKAHRVCYVEVKEADGDYVYFQFYDTAEHAKEDKRNYNVFVWFLSVLHGESRWLHTDTYNNISYEYLDKDLMNPFWELIQA